MSRMVDVDDSRWLLVGLERSGGHSKRLLEETKELDLNGYPSELLVVAGERYSFDKRGTATASLEGNTGTLSGRQDHLAHRCRWWSYSAPGGKTLLVEQWGDDYRCLVGDVVKDTDVEFMPGS